jgi:hypothetical protein
MTDDDRKQQLGKVFDIIRRKSSPDAMEAVNVVGRMKFMAFKSGFKPFTVTPTCPQCEGSNVVKSLTDFAETIQRIDVPRGDFIAAMMGGSSAHADRVASLIYDKAVVIDRYYKCTCGDCASAWNMHKGPDA